MRKAKSNEYSAVASGHMVSGARGGGNKRPVAETNAVMPRGSWCLRCCTDLVMCVEENSSEAVVAAAGKKQLQSMLTTGAAATRLCPTRRRAAVAKGPLRGVGVL